MTALRPSIRSEKLSATVLMGRIIGWPSVDVNDERC
jgi:hypothetical protein